MNDLLDRLEEIVKNKTEIESLDDFSRFLFLFPQKAIQINNSINLIIQLYRQSGLSEQKELSLIIEDLDLVSILHEKMNFPQESVFVHSHGVWFNESIDFFNVNITRESAKDLLQMEGRQEIQLKLSNKKFSTYEPINSDVKSAFLNQVSKKLVGISLSVGITMGISAYHQEISKIFETNSKVEINESDKLENVIESIKEHVSKNDDPQIRALFHNLTELNLHVLQGIPSNEVVPDESMVEDMILSFYENKNPAHITKIKEFIPKIVQSIIKHTKDNKIDYKILLAILKTESDFNQDFVSHSKDYSVAQVNYEIWSKEFKRMKKENLDKERLQKDIDYSIQIMTKIIALLEERHGDDPFWYARYHSSTPSRKIKYAKKVDRFNKELSFKEKELATIKLRETISIIRSLDYSHLDEQRLDAQSIKKLGFLLTKLDKVNPTVAFND